MVAAEFMYFGVLLVLFAGAHAKIDRSLCSDDMMYCYDTDAQAIVKVGLAGAAGSFGEKPFSSFSNVQAGTVLSPNLAAVGPAREEQIRCRFVGVEEKKKTQMPTVATQEISLLPVPAPSPACSPPSFQSPSSELLQGLRKEVTPQNTLRNICVSPENPQRKVMVTEDRICLERPKTCLAKFECCRTTKIPVQDFKQPNIEDVCEIGKRMDPASSSILADLKTLEAITRSM